MTQEERWTFCKLRARWRVEQREKLKETAQDAFVGLCAVGWLVGALAISGLI